MIRCLSPLLLLTLLTSSAFGGQSSSIYDSKTVGFPWPGGAGGNGPFQDAQAGQFTPDRVPDVIVLKGNTAVFSYGPALYNAFHNVATGVQSMTVIPRGAPSGLDALATIQSSGLAIHWPRAETSAFITTLLNDSQWIGATNLHCVDLDQQNGADLVAIDANGKKLLRAVNMGPGIYISESKITLSNFAETMIPVEWDGDERTEFALAHNQGLSILDGDGTSLREETSASGGLLCRFQDRTSSTDNLAWMPTSSSPTKEVLIVLDPSGVEHPLTMNTIGTVAIRAGDLDQDGNDDLVLSGKVSHNLAVFINQQKPQSASTTFSLGLEDFFLIGISKPPSAPAPYCEAPPLISDLNGDKDLDIYFTVESQQEFVLISNNQVDETTLVPQLQNLMSYENLIENESGGPGGTAPPGTQTPWGQGQTTGGGGVGGINEEPEAKATLVLSIDPSPSIPGDAYPATHVQVTMWSQPRYGIQPGPTAVQHEFIPLLTDPEDWPLKASILVNQRNFPFLTMLNFELRYVLLSEFGQVLESYPANTCRFTVDPETMSLLEQATGQPSAYSALFDGAKLSGTESSAQVGYVSSRLRMPDFVVGDIPFRPVPIVGPPLSQN